MKSSYELSETKFCCKKTRPCRCSTPGMNNINIIKKYYERNEYCIKQN